MSNSPGSTCSWGMISPYRWRTPSTGSRASWAWPQPWSVKRRWSQREISEHHFAGQITRDCARHRRKKLSWLAGVRVRRRRRNRKLQPAQRRQPGLRGSAGHRDGTEESKLLKQKLQLDFITLNWGLIWWVYLHITLLIALFSKSFNLCQVENSFADFWDKTCVRKTCNKSNFIEDVKKISIALKGFNNIL